LKHNLKFETQPQMPILFDDIFRFTYLCIPTRPTALSFRENTDLEANKPGSHTNAVGQNVCILTFRPTAKCHGGTKKYNQSFYTKMQTGESGGKDKHSFYTKETVPPNPHSLENLQGRGLSSHNIDVCI